MPFPQTSRAAIALNLIIMHKITRSLVTIFTIPCILALSSCASIVSKSNYSVNVRSETSPTKVDIRNREGKTVHTAMTPTTVTLPASSGYFQPEAYTLETRSGSQELNGELDPWYLGNIIFGGLIGIILVDPLTGSMWKLPKEATIR